MRYSKTTTSVLVLVCGAICGWTSAALAGPPDDQIIISEVVDATLPGGLPKYVELTNCGSPTVELSLYSLGNFNNGSTKLGGDASTVLGGTLGDGESYVVAYEFAPSDVDCVVDADCGSNQFCPDGACISTFENTYGFPPDQFIGPFVNGDDVIALFFGPATGDGSDAILIDIYGEIGVDGTGEVWEYTDSYSFRLSGVTSPTPVFDPNEWFFAGANALEVGGDDDLKLPVIQKNTTPGVHACTAGSCPADFDEDGTVGASDLAELLGNWGLYEPCPPFDDADFDEDCDINAADLAQLLGNWGPCP